MRDIRFIIYDLDGLLLDTEPFYTQTCTEIAARYGKVFTPAIKAQIMGRKATEAAEIFVKALDLPIDARTYLSLRKVILDVLFVQSKPRPGAEELVKHFAHHQIGQALATSTDSQALALKMQNNTWLNLLPHRITGDDPTLKAGKPAPDIFLKAAQKLGALPHECLVFEDAPLGVQAAKAAGMTCIMVPDPNIPNTIHCEPDDRLKSLLEFKPSLWGLPG